MAAKFIKEENLFAFKCTNCGIYFALDKEADDNWRDSGRAFFCPNGHSLSYKKEDKVNSLEKEIKSLKEKNESLDKTVKELKLEIERLKSELEIWHPVSES